LIVHIIFLVRELPENLQRNDTMFGTSICFFSFLFTFGFWQQLCPHIMHYGKVDSSTNSLKFGLSRPCRSGEECCLSYGNFSSSHFITFYGFLPQGDNPYDVIPLGNIIALFLSIHMHLNSQATSLTNLMGLFCNFAELVLSVKYIS
jgi:hypothetical protein